MKILMVLGGTFPRDERVEKEALALMEAGYAVTIACLSRDEPSGTYTYKGIELIKRKCSNFLYKKASAAAITLPFYFQFWRSFLTDILRKETFDFLHLHDLPLAKVSISISKKHRIPLIIDFHENYPYMLAEETRSKTLLGKLLIPISQWVNYEKWTMNQLKYGICVVQDMAERLERINSSPKLAIVDNTVVLSDWQEVSKEELMRNTSATEISLVFVGGLTPKRGLETAIRGIREFKKKYGEKTQCTLDIYGPVSPQYKKVLSDLISHCGVSEDVKLRGFIKLPEDGHQLTQYDFAIIPNKRSVQTDCSSPNKLYQYLYHGLPILTSDCTSIKRFIEKYDVGAVHQAENPVSFADGMHELMKKAQSDSNIRQRCHQTVLEKYNWNITKLNLIGLYSDIISEQR